jgi:hypothetical protein
MRNPCAASVLVPLCLAFLVSGAGTARAASGTARLRGQIIASDQPVPTLDDEDKMADTLKKWQKSTIERPKDADGWSFHLVSFPDKKPGVTTLSLLFYDVSDGKAKYLTSKDITCDANAEILAAEVEIDSEDGIKPGMKVGMTLARVVGGKQTDLAKAKLTFK